MTTKIEIPFESAESAKNLIGKTLVNKAGKEIRIISWQGTEYTLEVGGVQAIYQVMIILDQISKGLMEIKNENQN